MFPPFLWLFPFFLSLHQFPFNLLDFCLSNFLTVIIHPLFFSPWPFLICEQGGTFVRLELKQKNQGEGKRGFDVQWAYLSLPCYVEKMLCLSMHCLSKVKSGKECRNFRVKGRAEPEPKHTWPFSLALPFTICVFYGMFFILSMSHFFFFVFLKWECYYLTVVSRNVALMIFAPWYYILLHDKRDFVDIIKVTNMLSLRLGDYFESSSLGQCTHVKS